MRAHLKKAIARVIAGEAPMQRIGTAFLVSEHYAITALHVVADRARMSKGETAILDPISITFTWTPNPVRATVVDNCWDSNDDWALLKVENVPEGVSPMVSFGILPDGATPPFEAFGYPIDHGSLMVGGQITDARANYFDANVLQLFTKEAAAGKGDPLNGLSGAPCIVGSHVVGVVRAHPVKEELNGFSKSFTVRNGVLFACPIGTIASRCAGLFPAPTQLTFKIINRSLALEEEQLASLKHYKAALHTISATLPYHLPGREDLSINSAHIDLPAATASKSQNPITGSAAELTARGLESHRAVIIVGAPGSGKTSLFHFLSQVLWDTPERARFSQRRVVILCRLRDLAKASEETAGGRIRRAMASNRVSAMGGQGISEDFLDCWTEQTNSKLLFLFDGFDEVRESDREDLAIWLKSLLDEYPDSQCVISARGVDLFNNTKFKVNGGLATYVQLCPPTHEQAIAVASTWIHNDASHFVQRIRDSGIGDTLSTPLGIALSASVFSKLQILPENRASLYEAYVRIALEEAIRQGAEIQADLKLEALQYLLQRLAYLSTQCSEVTDLEAMKEIQAVLRERYTSLSYIELKVRSEGVYRVLKERSGILLDASEWKHETFREFLAAQYMVAENKPNSSKVVEIIRKHTDLNWQGLLLFLFSFWSQEASKSTERDLELYRSVFEEIIDAPGNIHRASPKWMQAISKWFKPAQVEMLSEMPIPSVRAVFAVKALLEIGAAPRDIEERILRLLLANPRHIERAMGSPCSSVFSTDLYASQKLRLLECWAKNSRLNKLLDPWVRSWSQILSSCTGTGLREFGLLWLCRRDHEIEEILEQRPARRAWSNAVFHTLHWYSRRDREEAANRLRRIAMKALREQRKNDMESIVELTTISGYINDASRLFSGHNFKRTLNPFSNRVWLEVFMETIRAMDEAGKCLKEDPPDPNRLAKAFNALGNRTWIELVSKVWAKSKNFNAPFIVAIECLNFVNCLNDIRASKETPPALRRFIEWYLLLPEKDRAENVARLWGEYCLTMSTDLLGLVGALLMPGIPTPILTEELLVPDTPKEFAEALVDCLKANGAYRELLSLGTSEQASRQVRILALESLAFEEEYRDECTMPLLCLCKEYLSEQPGDVSVLKTRARLLNRLERYEEAEVDLTAVLSISPEDCEALELRSWAQYSSERNEAALEDIERSLRVKGDHKKGFFIKGLILLDAGFYRDAIASFDESEKSGITSSPLYVNRARSYFLLGFLEEAIKDLGKVIDQDQSHGPSRLQKALCLSFLGRWSESEALIEGMEHIPSAEENWVLMRLQNELGLRGLKSALSYLSSLSPAYELSPWEQTIRLFLERAWIKGDQKAGSDIVETLFNSKTNRPYMQCQFWLFILTEDVVSSRSYIDRLIESMCEADLRWIVLNAHRMLGPFLPAWVTPLIGQVAYALGSLTPPGTVLTSKQDIILQENEAQTRSKKTKYIYEQGKICRCANIHACYEDEMEMGSTILRSYNQCRAIIVIPLVDSGHVYIQSNVNDNEGYLSDFKMSAEFNRLRDEGVLAEIVRDARIQKVIITERSLYQQMLDHPALTTLRPKLVLESHSLPYTEKDVEFKLEVEN